MSLDTTSGTEEVGGPDRAPSPDELVARAEALVPKLAERALEAEEQRRLSVATFDELLGAEFHRILQPKRFGGFGLTHDVSAEVVRTLSRGCGSTGWIANLVTLHPWQVGLFGLEAQEDVWREEPAAYIATGSFATKSERRAVDGGYRLSGRWKFSSGCDFASWFMILKPTATNFDWMLVPRSDVDFVDDWYVSGLRGTGSKDILLDDVFVPSHRTVGFEDVMTANSPGSKLPDPVGNSKLTFLDAVVFSVPAAVIGMVQGLSDAFQRSLAGGKISQLTGELQVERPSNQIKLAEAQAAVEMALTVMRRRLLQLRGWSESGYPEDPVERLGPHRDAAYLTRRLVHVAAELGVGAGANATYYKSPVQRFVRDILSASSHASIAWEDVAEPYGRAKWGLPPKVLLQSE